MLSVLLRFTDYDYPFGILKHFVTVIAVEISYLHFILNLLMNNSHTIFGIYPVVKYIYDLKLVGGISRLKYMLLN